MARSRLLAAAVALAATTVAAAPAAHADPGTGDARARAATLRAQVEQLQVQAGLAAQRYDAAEARLGRVVTEHLLAQRQLEQAQQTAAAVTSRADDRARALYMAGGRLALLATVLDGTSPADVIARYHDAQAVLSADRAHVGDSDATVSAAAAADRVRSVLAQQNALLAQADAEVLRLVAEQQAAAQAADAARFAARLAAARVAAGIDPGLAGSEAPPNDVAAAAIAAARTRLGRPYVWGGAGPDTFDCSGLTQWAYAQAGISLPRVAADQWNAGPHPSLAALAPGDLLFWATDPADPTTIYHEAMYVGGGMMIVAPHTGDVVKVEPVYLTDFVGATRPTAGL